VVEKYRQIYLPTLKAATQYGYGVVIDTRLLPRFGKLPIERVDAVAVRELDASMATDGLRTSTRRTVLAIVRSILCRFAVEAKYLPAAPALPKPPKKSRTAVLALSRAEVDALLNAAKCSEHKVPLALAAFAGLRAGEIRALRWRDVDLVRGELVVRFARCRGVTDKPKSGHDRVIPIAREVRVLLKGGGGGGGGGGAAGDELVARTTHGKPWGQYGLREAFSAVAKRAGVEGFHFHCLRHFFISELFDKGVGAPTVQELAGHAHLETTARYAHTRKGSAHDAIRRLSGPSSEDDNAPIAAE
jgi:integrase